MRTILSQRAKIHHGATEPQLNPKTFNAEENRGWERRKTIATLRSRRREPEEAETA
jgi:hypothetical protein